MFPPAGVIAEIPLPLGTCKLEIHATLQGSLLPFGQTYRHPRSRSAEFCSIDQSVAWMETGARRAGNNATRRRSPAIIQGCYTSGLRSPEAACRGPPGLRP